MSVLRSHCDYQALNKQKFINELFHSYALRGSFALAEPNFLTANSRRLLETVLKYCNINAVPSTNEQYLQLINETIQNVQLVNMNVVVPVKSLVDLVNKEAKLYKLIVSELGFSQENRSFTNYHNSNQNSGAQNEIITLKDFLLALGTVYDILRTPNKYLQRHTTSNDNQLFRLHSSSDDIQNQLSLISPESSQEQIEAQKRSEQTLIQQVFQANQEKQKQIPLHNQTFDELAADEELIVEPSLQYGAEIRNQLRKAPSVGSQQQQQYSELTKLLSKTGIQQQQSMNQQQQQKPSFLNKITKSPFRISNQQTPLLDQFKRYDHSSKFAADSLNPFNCFKSYSGESLLSANNTPMKPVFKNDSSYFYYSEQKQPRIQKNLFTRTPESPMTQAPSFYNKIGDNAHSKSLFFSHYNQTKPFNFNLSKRQPEPLTNLENQVNKETCFQTPLKSMKRFKLDPYTENKEEHKEEKQAQLSDDEDRDDQNNQDGDNNSVVNRKMRGLKILSVKVQELVYKKQSTTYKDVANELIQQLRDNKKNKDELGLGGDDSSNSEDEYLSDESPNKKSRGEDSSSQQLKWEKNVRRRVYDALNVLYAAGVLKKEGKHVSCDNKALQLTNKLKEISKQATSSATKQLSAHDQKLLHQIESLKQQLQTQKQRCDEKREYLQEQFKNYISYKHLIERNKDREGKGIFENEKINLPFIIVSTKDNPDNEVEISFGENNKSLNIAMKKPMKCMGDADTLMKLKLYKVGKEWMQAYIPESFKVMNLLSDKQVQEIVI